METNENLSQNMNSNMNYQMSQSVVPQSQFQQPTTHLPQQQQQLNVLQQQQQQQQNIQNTAQMQQQPHAGYMQNMPQAGGQIQNEIFNQQLQLKQIQQQQQQIHLHSQQAQQQTPQHQQIPHLTQQQGQQQQSHQNPPILVNSNQLPQQQMNLNNNNNNQSILIQQIQSPGQRMPLNAGKVITTQQQQQQQQAGMVNINQGQQLTHLRQGVQGQAQPQQTPTQIMQSHTPPIVQPQQPQMIQNYNQIGQMQQQTQQAPPVVQNISINKQPIFAGSVVQDIRQPQQGSALTQAPGYAYSQPQKTAERQSVWEGYIEWTEKDRSNPNSGNKVKHQVKARLLSPISQDPSTGQLITDVSPSMAQCIPPKLMLQLLSKQVLELLLQHCTPPTKNLYLITEGNNADVKAALSIGVIFIYFSSFNKSATY